MISVRDAAAVLDHLEPAGHLAERVGEDLAVLAREDLGHLLAPRVRASSRMRKKSSARFASDVSRQAGKAVLRRLDGGVHLLDRREVDGAGLAAGRRVVDRAAAAGAALDAAAADPVRDARDGGRVDRLGHVG